MVNCKSSRVLPLSPVFALGAIGLLAACGGGGSPAQSTGSGTGSTAAGSSGSSGSTMSGSSGSPTSGSSGSTPSGSAGSTASGSGSTESGASGSTASGSTAAAYADAAPDAPAEASTEGGDGAGPMCVPASADAGSPAYLLPSGPLPFVVDKFFFASGYEGDTGQIHLGLGLATNDAGVTDLTCGGDRSSANALGSCYKWTYDNVAAGTALNDAGAKAQGFGAVEYQSLSPSMNYSANWGTSPGVVIPPGATMVSFWAKGAVGGEVVGFGVGQIKGALCNDAIIVADANETLTTTWTHYTIALPVGQSYASGQIIAFNWVAAYQGPSAGDGGNAAGSDASASSPITFFLDDMEWVGPAGDAGSTDAESDTGSSDATGQ
jgi:hypothetical protein